MKRMIVLVLAGMSLLLSGCGKEAAPEPVQTTVATVTIQETEAATEILPPETEPQEPKSQFFQPYWTENGKLELHCLIRNDTPGVLSIESMDTCYTLNGAVVQEKHYEKNQLSKFLWRPYNDLDLMFAASSLLFVDDCPTAQNFDQALVTITTRDEAGLEHSLTYPFTMKEGVSFADQIPVVEKWGVSWLPDGGWNWDHPVTNDTEETLTLEYIHRVTYDNGIPITAGYMEPSQYDKYIKTIACMEPGTSATYTEGIMDEQRMNANVRETVYVYRDSEGNPYTYTYYFRYEDAVSKEVYFGMPEGLQYLIGDAAEEVMGGRKYTEAEIRQMVADNLTLDEVAEKISTVADVTEYLNWKGFYYTETAMHSLYYQDYRWNLNTSAQRIFQDNFGACGDGSQVINYILRGDYDQQGYVMEVNSKDRHIYNWFKEDGVYYFVDWTLLNLNGKSENRNFILYAAEDPQLYSDYFIKLCQTDQNRYETWLQYMVIQDGLVPPIGIHRQSPPYTRVMPEQYRDRVTLLYENPAMCILEYLEGPPEEMWME